MKILMLVLNTFENDSRVHRCAQTLVEAGHQVKLLCLAKEGLPNYESIGGYEVYRKDLLSQKDTNAIIKNRIIALKKNNKFLFYISSFLYLPIYKIYSLKIFIKNFFQDNFNKIFIKIKAQIKKPVGKPIRDLYWFCLIKWRLVSNKIPQYPPNFFLKLVRYVFFNLIRLSKRIKRYIHRLFTFLSSLSRKILKQDSAFVSFEKRRVQYDLFKNAVLKFCKNYKPDIVHAHDFNTLIAAYALWKKDGIPYVYDTHELWVHRNRPNVQPSEEEVLWEKTSEHKMMRSAEFSITVCDSIAEHLAREYKINKPIVIRNTPYFKKVVKDPQKSLRKRLGISEDDFLAVYVGIVSFNRGVTDILYAMPMLDSKVKFVTLGLMRPAFKIEFDRIVDELGIGDRVFCHDPVPSEEVSTWVSDADLSLTTMNRVCLSYVYTLPNKLFESVQGGVPIIGPDSPEIISVVDKYKCGTVYKDTDSRDLANKIIKLFEDRSLLSDLALGAQAAGDDLCWEKEKKKLLDAYRKLFVNTALSVNTNVPLSNIG